MSYNLVLHRPAQDDFEKAFEWYAARSVNAAENFIVEVESTLQLISNNPRRWRNEHNNFRELGVKKFPYVIIYTLDEKAQLVTVTAIFHTSKNPRKKNRKSK